MFSNEVYDSLQSFFEKFIHSNIYCNVGITYKLKIVGSPATEQQTGGSLGQKKQASCTHQKLKLCQTKSVKI